MPLNITTGAMSARGFGFTTQGYFNLTITLSSNQTSYNLRTAALAAGWTATNKLNAVLNVNSGVSLIGTGGTTSSGLVLTNLVEGSIVRLNNSGTIYGAGGAGGRTNYAGALFQEAGNVSGIGTGGSNGFNPYGDSNPAISGSSGGVGSSAIYCDSNIIFNIYNYGIVTGGGGGAGGQGSNNAGGGSGGDGGIALVETSTPTITLYNQSGGVFGGGGGGGSGWGNRNNGATQGGTTGVNAVITINGGGNFGSQGSAGRSSTNNATPIINTAGTFSL
jgi:hypothetical protein